MRCPRCMTPTLDEKVRQGVSIDVCQACQGIWLDRGELEKLLEADREHQADLAEGQPQFPDDTPPFGHRRGLREESAIEGPRPGRGEKDGQRRPRRRRWIDVLGDLLD